MSRYVVGIDLGTTHTVVAYASLGRAGGASAAIRLLDMAQLVAPGEHAALPLLPSVRYHAAQGELAGPDMALPWVDHDASDTTPAVIGQWARTLGAQVPGRLVSSAKSWLSHPDVDRLAAILPWGAAPEVHKISPVQASASYLAYVRAAWNHQFPKSPLEHQELVLTVPASFDEGARALTLSAAHMAGLPTLRLVEEPQAVFYDWLLRHRKQLAQALADTRLVLVCDVGGGTTDLSLIQVDLVDGEPQLTRIGVGNHLMLGGDNMDLALAHVVEARLASSGTPGTQRLSASQMSQLMSRCRSAKEQLLAADAPQQVTVTLLGSGVRLVGGSRSTTLTRTDVAQLLVDGFFPQVQANAQVHTARAGIVEFGLPYARDPAITRHIADFLRQHDQAMPDTLLLNGGVFRADALVQRLTQTLGAWRGSPLRLLHNDNPDLAVARGAVAYAMAQRGLAPKIGGGSARSYFLQLAGHQGICVLPRGTAVACETLLPERSFSLTLGKPVRFQLFSAVSDVAQRAPFVLGDLVSLDQEGFFRLPPIATVLRAFDEANTKTAGQNSTITVPVGLTTTLTEVGTLEMHCVHVNDPGQRWLLEFDLRHQQASSEVTVDASETASTPRLTQAVALIERIFGTGAAAVPAKEVRQLRMDMERVLGERERWGTAVLRPLFDALYKRARGRRRSVEHERVWLNLAGYCLRPGFGAVLDDWRVQQLWLQFPLGVQHSNDKQVRTEWWTLWRRVAGGLSSTEQQRLLQDFAANLHSNIAHEAFEAPPDAAQRVKGANDDMLRLGAALEHIPSDYKAEIGEWLLGTLKKTSDDSLTLWALGRIGARQPNYGHAHDVVAADIAIVWVETLLALDWKQLESAAFAAMQLARVTDDRTRDLPLALRERIAERLQTISAPSLWRDMVLQRVELDTATESRMLGEALPPGLKLIRT
jgi:molecular chaperone DnaK (HSP70)/urease accessory protein UreF